MFPPDDLTTPPASGLDLTEDHLAIAIKPAPRPAGLPDAPPGYTLERELGHGGMGVVYLASQQGLNRPVALKMVLAAADDRALIRFLAEAEAVAAVRHPNVVEVYHFGQHAGRPFLALEFCPGGDLDAVAKAGPVEARRAIELMASVAEGVAAAHALGIVHRDLKPHNVMLDAAGQPKVTDFGLAKQVAAGAGLTATEAILGTPAYMAPEQAAGGTKFVGPPADVWSLGVMLYELLAGERPFTGGDSWAVLGQVVSGQCTPLSTAAPGVPRDLTLIVGHCLAMDPRDRYASATDLAADLRAWLSGGTITVRPAGPVETATKWARRNPAVTVALTVALTALTLGTAVSTWQSVRAGEKAVAARAAEKRADDERDAARLAEGKAANERNLAVKAEQRAQRQLTRAEWLVYGNQIDLMARSWDDGRPKTTADNMATPRRDFRGWEHALLFTQTATSSYQLNSHTGSAGGVTTVSDVVFSPDGRRVATASWDKTARLWDAGTGAAVAELKGHSGWVTGVAFSPDGVRMATASYDDTARLWDAKTGVAMAELKGHTSSLAAVAFSPDGKRVATASYDDTARLWDAKTGAAEAVLHGHTGGVIAIAFSPDGRRVATGSNDDTARLWDVRTGAAVSELKGHTGSVSAVAFRPDGRRVATASDDGTGRLWDAGTSAALLELKGHTEWVRCITFSPDGGQVATASGDGTARLWDAGATVAVAEVKTHLNSPVTALAFTPDGHRVATASQGGSVRLSDAKTGAVSAELKRQESTSAMAFSPNGQRVARAFGDGTARLCNAGTGAAVADFVGHTGKVNALAFSPDGRRLATASDDNTVRLWDAGTGAAVLELKGHTGKVNRLAA